MKTTREILQVFEEESSEVFAENFTANHCLNGSRVAMEALKKFRITASPWSVELTAMNSKWYDLVKQNGGWPASWQESDAWADAGGYALTVDVQNKQPRDGGWPGHLIVIAGGFLVDSSLGQVSREGHGIVLPDVFIADIPAGFLDDAREASYRFEPGSIIYYRVRPQDRSYLDMPGFQRSPQNLEVAAEIVQRMKRRLA